MSVQTTTLANGMRVVSYRMDHLETVSLGVWAAVGARHETRELNGISHFLEHMAFKGTGQRSAQEIAEEIEARGGDLNAATSLETTGYYARVLKGDDGAALEILADILMDSVFSEDEMARERAVILQEIAGANDSPDDLVYDLIQDAAYPDQAIGRKILGTPETVAEITPEHLKGHLADYYRADSMVLSAAGAVDHDAMCRHASALFGGLSQGRDNGSCAVGVSPARYEGGLRSSERPFEQSHVVIGFEGPRYGGPDFFAAQVFSGLLGGGMSSRLFQEVREKRGLCYAIYSSAWGLSDTGMLAVHAASGPEMMNELVEVIASELKRVADDGVLEKELERAKAQLKAGLLMGLESSHARAEQMARHLIAHRRLIPKEELIAQVESVSAQQVGSLVETMLASEPCVCVVGAGEKSVDYASRARAQFAPVAVG